MIVNGNDLMGTIVTDPCGCTATSQDAVGMCWELRVCYDHRKKGGLRKRLNDAKRMVRRKRKTEIKRGRR